MANNWSHVDLLFNKDQYTGVDNIKYKFKCTVCNFQFKYSIDNGRIPICRKCNPIYQQNRSNAEDEIIKYIESLVNTTIETNNRTICNGKELDILLPEYKFAIEYNGIYWHNDDNVSKQYHLHKTKAAIMNGYSLLHIFDYHWITKQPIVKSIIRSKLNLSERIHARKCTVKIVTSKEKNDFLDETHLQGKCNSKINLGLYYNNELVNLMTFGLPRYSKEYDYFITRNRSIGTTWEYLEYKATRYDRAGDSLNLKGLNYLFYGESGEFLYLDDTSDKAVIRQLSKLRTISPGYKWSSKIPSEMPLTLRYTTEQIHKKIINIYKSKLFGEPK
jgi:hypothetical protein